MSELRCFVPEPDDDPEHSAPGGQDAIGDEPQRSGGPEREESLLVGAGAGNGDEESPRCGADESDCGEDDEAPGGLLAELEQRQEVVLAELDALNAKIEGVLRSLGVRLEGEEAA
jgi:hypothetical protein